MSAVVGFGLREDQDVVNVNTEEFVDEVVEDIVDEGLKGGRSVGETKGHHDPFERPILGPESGFWNVFWDDANLMITTGEIEFGKILGLAEPI